MSTSETSRFVRLRVEMVLEITDPAALSGTALESIAAEYGEPGGEPAEERMQAETAVREDGAEALASLVDPFDLVSEVPGVELTQASWSSESVDYDPDAPDGWDLDDEDDEWGAGDVPHNGEDDGEHSGASGGADRRI
ncbi:hypothetical protein [Streptomyces atratus]|uniref:hypothetical protein n=1 Tax=Streptomyces atratus TaxID=1893 RepID=UPI002256507A|nr:hypothetical protein [Streptomyces atratus]MCX5341280.1 hypothetical protein [Streptomyces atratus]